MPKEKSIEMQSISLTAPFFVTSEFFSMYDLSEYIQGKISESLKILEEPELGALSYEHNNENTVYRIQKLTTDKFAIWNVAANTIETKNSTDTLAIIYAHMPYVDMVGKEINMSILDELAKRKKNTTE